ncbi:MAG: histidinol-phosphate transaminase [Sandaracinaceae bacterium]
MSALTSLVGARFAELSAYRTRPDPAPVKLDANESPWPLPEPVQRALAEALGAAPLHRYPDLLARDVRAALAARLGTSPDTLVCGVGSDEVIGLLLRVFDRPRPGRPAATVLYPTPSFVMYPITAKVHGVTPVEVPLQPDFTLDVPAMRAALSEHRPNLVFLATPNNPTGNPFSDAALRELIEAAPDTLFVLDEAYAPFAGRTLRGWVDAFPNVAVMGTLSKVGLAGLRLGWVQLAPSLAQELEKARPPYNLAMPTQRAATLLLRDHADALDQQVASIVSERQRLHAALSALPSVRPLASSANFILVEVGDAATVHTQLLERGVQVRRFAKVPRLGAHLRITVGSPAENTALLEALRAVVG